MKHFFLVVLLFGAACTQQTQKEQTTDKELVAEETPQEIVMKNFQLLVDSANVDGSILILSKNTFYSNDFEWANERHIPASTFKIPNSMIALELGILESDSSMIYWDGKQRFMDRWEQDLSLRDAFHLSCVPCYQEIARKVGVDRMIEKTNALNFGKLIIDSTNIDQFWLTDDAQISQFEEIDFLKRFHEKELPISERTHEIMNRMMIIEQDDRYVLRGKTGWSDSGEEHNCWFVGSVESDGVFHYFATNITPAYDTDISEIVSIRKEISIKALKQLEIL
ncbi:MAG: class D beta-lactamase [Flavobacteriales bacterium]|nr:class D beta-lactamase [Flavobacteriales bacterium]